MYTIKRASGAADGTPYSPQVHGCGGWSLPARGSHRPSLRYFSPFPELPRASCHQRLHCLAYGGLARPVFSPDQHLLRLCRGDKERWFECENSS